MIHLIIINTDALIEILDKQSIVGQQIVEKIRKSNDSFAITALTLMKVLYGFIKFQKNVPPIHLLQICDFSKKDAQKATELQIDLEKKGKIIDKTFVMTGAIAINKCAYLCTLDKKFYDLSEYGLKLFLDIS
jgi:predicted nucleic acid-binding protein